MAAPLPPGRPRGSTTFDPEVAATFGSTVVELRSARGISQLALALEAAIERAHVGRIERGERIPNLVAIVKIARALDCTATDLIANFEAKLNSKQQT